MLCSPMPQAKELATGCFIAPTSCSSVHRGSAGPIPPSAWDARRRGPTIRRSPSVRPPCSPPWLVPNPQAGSPSGWPSTPSCRSSTSSATCPSRSAARLVVELVASRQEWGSMLLTTNQRSSTGLGLRRRDPRRRDPPSPPASLPQPDHPGRGSGRRRGQVCSAPPPRPHRGRAHPLRHGATAPA